MKNSILIIILLFYNTVFSQDPSSIEHNFGANPNFDNSVNTIVYQADSKIIVGGEFTMYNMTSCNHIVRLNPDGQIDTSFNIGTGFNGNVNIIKIQSDGKILVGGNFTKFNGLYADGLVRLNTNGTLDSSFMPYINFSLVDNVSQGCVYGIGIQSDGKIIISGALYLRRINGDGSLDNTFNNFYVNSNADREIFIQADGKILLLDGRHNTDGSIDNTFVNPMLYFPKAIQSDGKILMLGYDNKVYRFNINGTLDPSFISGSGFNIRPNKFVLQNDGKIIIGGDFTSYNGVDKNYVLRLNSNGSIDTSFNVPQNVISVLPNGSVNVIKEIVVQPDSKIIIGGGNNNFSKYVRLNNNGNIDNSFTGLDGIVECITLQSDSKILVGGSFNSYNGQSKNKIIRFNSNGENDSLFDIGSGFNGTVYSIAMQTDNKILVGGDFTIFNGINCGKISRLNTDGSIDNSFITGIGFNGIVNKITLQSDGKIIIIGTFTTYNNVNSRKIIRLNQNGSIDNTFNLVANIDGNFKTLEIQSDGKIYIGGNSITNNSAYIGSGSMLKLNSNGTLDSSFNSSGNHFLESVNDILIESSGNIILVGSGGSNLTGDIIRIAPNGTVINFSYQNIVGTIKSLALQSDGKIIICTSDGAPASIPTVRNPIGILRLNSNFTIDNTFFNNNNNEFDWRPVNSFVIQNDGKIIVGGNFLYYNLYSFSSFLVRINGVCNVSSPPIISSIQALESNSTISNLIINGTNIKWFSLPTGGSQLTATTNLVNNTTYYASQTINGCESYRIPVLVNLYSVANLPAVTIGNKIWSNNNLNVSTYTDGTIIPQVSSPSEWAYLTTGAWCYYNNDPANELGYGKLYNWYAVAGIYDWDSLNNPILRKQLAPIGWHIPHYNEWQELSNNNSSNSLRESGTSHWAAPNTGATNSTGFSALPGGGRRLYYSNSTFFDYSAFGSIGYVGSWWANPLDYINQVSNSNNCNCINLLNFQVSPIWYQGFGDAGLYVDGFSNVSNEMMQKNGLSVRCVKDDVSSLSNNQTNTTDNLVNKVKYFPNPIIDILNVQSSLEINYLKINNILGQTIFQNPFNSKSAQINTSDFPSGIYIVTLESEGKKETFKIIKK